jgi:hypothetical protein
MTKMRVAAAVLVAALVTAALPAAAETWKASDPLGDGGSGTYSSDLVRVKVNHAERRIYIRVRYDEFVGEVLKGHLDLRRPNPGPEFNWLFAPQFAPYTTNLYRVDGWGSVLSPGSSWDLHPCQGLRTRQVSAQPPVFVTGIPRRCLRLGGSPPARIRVSVAAGDAVGGSDWVPGRREWSPWVAHD